jgi:Na+-transporting methylmalonyl-CoA/oxaloacetate decarboxylase gamma subunit
MELSNLVLATFNASDKVDAGTGALVSIIAIAMVFAVLGIIIGVTTLVFKINGLFEMKKKIEEDAKKLEETKSSPASSSKNEPVEISDDDMMAAVLVATIDYRSEIKKDVRVVSVKEVK